MQRASAVESANGLLAQNVVAVFERPDREIEVRRCRRADVDEVDVLDQPEVIARGGAAARHPAE